MTTILMMFLFPIGLYTYFVIEKKTKKEYQLVFDDFQKKITNSKITKEEKKHLFEQMLLKNGYTIVSIDQSTVVGEKKVLSIAFIMMGLGIYIIGLFFYLAYYFWFQKPHRVEFCI